MASTACYVSGIFLFAFTLSSSASVVIFPSSGNINVCLGETRTFTCNVTGAVFLVWEYDFGVDALFSSSDNNTGPLTSDIYVELVSRAGGVIQVRAIVNATSNINGKTLRCRNTPGSVDSTISRDIIFNVQNPSAPRLVVGKATKATLSNVTIDVFWPNAVCANMYEINITRESGLLEQTITTNETAYSVPSNVGDCYDISVYSIDYAGRRVGSPVSTRVPVKLPYFSVITAVVSDMDDSAILTISIQAAPTVCQSPFMSCNISLTNNTFHSSISSCSQGEFHVTIGDIYDYNVTVTNFVGISSIGNSFNITGPLRITITVAIPTSTPTVTEPQHTFSTESTTIIAVLGVLLLLMTVLFVVVFLVLFWRQRCYSNPNAVVDKDISQIQMEQSDENQTEM